MEIRISCRHDIKANDTTREFIAERLSKLERFYDKITSSHVIVDSEFLNKVVEIIINCRGHTVKSKAKAENIGKALDEAMDRAERQLKKINARIKDHKGKGDRHRERRVDTGTQYPNAGSQTNSTS